MRPALIALLAVLAALSFWALGAFVDSAVYHHGTFLDCLVFGGDLRRFAVRLLLALVFGAAAVLFARTYVARKREKQELRFQAMLLDQIGDMITATDLEGRITYVNAADAASHGRTRAELVGQSIEIFGDDPERGATQRQVADKTLADGSWRGEIVTTARDGSQLVLDLRTWLIRDERGQPTGLCGISRDVTEEKNAEQALLESERRFHDVLEVSNDLTYKLDLETLTYDYVSSSAVTVLGFTPEEITAMGFEKARERFHPDDDQRLKEHFDSLCRHTFEKGAAPRIQYRWRHKSGEYRWYSDSRALLRDKHGEPEAIVGSIRDITARRLNEEALRKERDRAQQYLDIAGVILLVLNRAGEVELINKKGCEVLAGREEDIVGANWSDHFLPERNRERVKGIFARLLTGEIEAVEYAETALLTCRGEERLISWHNTVLRNDTGTIVATLSSGTDVTDRHHAEQERRRLEAQILHAQKLESLGVLAGGIAHDFNNLLMGILGNTGLALMELSPESPARPTLDQAEKAALRAAELTKQMLAYSGRGQFVVEPIGLSALVEEMAHLLKAVVSKKAVLKYSFAPNLPPVQADATQIRQVVMNLITNASDAIGETSGVITITTGMMEADRDYLSATYLDDDLPAGLYAYVEASDTGAGMDTETQSKLFDPFFTTKMMGRGLGLAAVLGIVRGHRGAIDVRSEPGRGSTFRVLLPCSPRSLPAGAAKPKAVERYHGEGAVLVVDDEEDVRTVAQNILRTAGFEIFGAPDGEEAVRAFREHADEIVLVLLDLTMPRMGGAEASREMHRIRPDVPVILSSGYNEQEASARMAGEAVAGFIQKPYRPMDLLAKAKDVLEG